MRIAHIEVYPFDELSERAKARVRDWYREHYDDDDYGITLEDAQEVLRLAGFAINTRSITYPKRTVTEPAIFFSGWGCQGDGACFEGRWSPETIDVAKLKEECPPQWVDAAGEHINKANAELLRIAEESLRLAGLDPQNQFGWTVKQSGRSYHEHCTEFEHFDATGEIEPPAALQRAHEENARDAMRWIYRRLEEEHEYFTSDSYIDEVLTGDGSEYLANGTLWGREKEVQPTQGDPTHVE